ncbi:MAG: hypothetical protein GX601_16660 [Anaerolineales bacterium]|nr:hypothetical protein [Anaerolineales bacterium]
MPYRKPPPLAAPRRIACLLGGEAATAEIAERLWEALGAHTPAVERDESLPVAFYLDAAGVAPRYGTEAGWCRTVLAEARTLGSAKARLGLAGCKFAAWVAAQTTQFEQSWQVVEEHDARFLAQLPVDWLPLTQETLRRLRVLGLHTLGKLAALPGAAVSEQFGPESLTAWRWARGQDERPLIGRRCQMATASHLLDAPEARGEELLATAVYLAERALCDLPVDRHAWAIRQVGIVALTDDGERLAAETWLGDTPGQETMCAVLARLIAPFHGEGAGIVELTVQLWGLEPAPRRQLCLLEAQETDLRWRQVVEVLGRRYPDGLLRSVLANPDAPILTERYALERWQA